MLIYSFFDVHYDFGCIIVHMILSESLLLSLIDRGVVRVLWVSILDTDIYIESLLFRIMIWYLILKYPCKLHLNSHSSSKRKRNQKDSQDDHWHENRARSQDHIYMG